MWFHEIIVFLILVLLFYIYVIFVFQYNPAYLENKAIKKLRVREMADVDILDCQVVGENAEITYKTKGEVKTISMLLASDCVATNCIKVLKFGQLVLN